MGIVESVSTVSASLLGWVSGITLAVISTLGYPGIFFLMTVESMIIPFPSELVMPFAGFLAADGRFSFWLVVIAGTAGSLCGSLISYAMGYYGGRPLVDKFGKYVLLDHSDLDWAEHWFKKHGDKTIFISRLLPVVRQLISIPAGMGEMNIKKFIFYTTAGAGIWMFVLTWAGFKLGENWERFHVITKNFSYVIILVLVVGGLYVLWKHVNRYRKRKR